MRCRVSRREVIRAFGVGVAASAFPAAARGQAPGPVYGYPMGIPGQPLGDGLFVRVAYAAENARYYPGWWHTGENWHRLEGETAGLGVYAVADGEVVFAGAEYPGRVVIVAHPDGLYAMYGHLDDALAVEPGQPVTRSDVLGTVLARDDDYWRSHLHFELRTFFTKPEINGSAPQYGVSCGFECPPGPGYWPMTAPDHPSQLGWRNPTHVINRRAWPEGIPASAEVTVATTAPERTPLWSAPSQSSGAAPLGELALTPGDRFPLLAIDAGDEASTATSAEATHLWYRIALSDVTTGWVQAAVPLALDSGADGRPSSLRFDFLPVVVTPGR